MKKIYQNVRVVVINSSYEKRNEIIETIKNLLNTPLVSYTSSCEISGESEVAFENGKEDEVIDDLTKQIWRDNRGYCIVRITINPTNRKVFTYNEEEYDKMTSKDFMNTLKKFTK